MCCGWMQLAASGSITGGRGFRKGKLEREGEGERNGVTEQLMGQTQRETQTDSKVNWDRERKGTL